MFYACDDLCLPTENNNKENRGETKRQQLPWSYTEDWQASSIVLMNIE